MTIRLARRSPLAAAFAIAMGCMCGPRDARPDDGGATSGDRCLPIAVCNEFVRPTACAVVHADGRVDLPARIPARPANVEHVCPGDIGADRSLHRCVDYVETQLSCYWRTPVRDPEFACGFVFGVCGPTAASR